MIEALPFLEENRSQLRLPAHSIHNLPIRVGFPLDPPGKGAGRSYLMYTSA